MKKSDLKTGMRITQQNGKTAIILLGTTQGDIFSCIGTTGTWGTLRSINEDLTYSSEKSKYDIVKVEDALYNMQFLHEYTTIWEREDKPIEYTMEELTEKLGHSFKIKTNLENYT